MEASTFATKKKMSFLVVLGQPAGKLKGYFVCFIYSEMQVMPIS